MSGLTELSVDEAASRSGKLGGFLAEPLLVENGWPDEYTRLVKITQEKLFPEDTSSLDDFYETYLKKYFDPLKSPVLRRRRGLYCRNNPDSKMGIQRKRREEETGRYSKFRWNPKRKRQ